MSTDLLLGIDGGGTRTQAVLLTISGKVIGVGEAGSSNVNNLGSEVAGGNLRSAAAAAFGAAGLPFAPAKASFLGMCATRSSGDIALMTSIAESRDLAPKGAVTVKNDLYNALAGGLDGEPGIAIIAGTGSNCLARDQRSNHFTCGGWGWFLGDEGSGFGLSADALRTAVRMADGREEMTPLLEAVTSYYEVPDPDFLMGRLYNNEWSPVHMAGFSPILVKLAAEGDPAALAILGRGAAALAELIATAASHLRFEEAPRVVLLGGCVRSGPPYQPLVEAKIREVCPDVRLQDPLFDTTYGAALNALRLVSPELKPDFSSRAISEAS